LENVPNDSACGVQIKDCHAVLMTSHEAIWALWSDSSNRCMHLSMLPIHLHARYQLRKQVKKHCRQGVVWALALLHCLQEQLLPIVLHA